MTGDPSSPNGSPTGGNGGNGDDDEAPLSQPPPSTRVLRVRKVGAQFGVYAADDLAAGPFDTKDEALAAARQATGERGGLILVEGEAGGFDAEAVPPSSKG